MTKTQISLAQKFFSILMSFLMVLNSVLPSAAYLSTVSPVYAADDVASASGEPAPVADPTPALEPVSTEVVPPVIEVVTPTETIIPVEEATPTVTPTEEPLVEIEEVVEELSPEATPAATPAEEEPAQEETPAEPAQETQPADEATPQEETAQQTEPVSELTPVEESIPEGVLAVVLLDPDAPLVENELLNTQESIGSASLVTDKPDYAPTEIVLITGADFTPGEVYTLVISSSDEPAATHEGQVTANEDGSFAYSYQLDGTYRPNYKAEAKDSSGQIVATVTFTDSNKVDICHATNSHGNPYVEESPNIQNNGDLAGGHLDHNGPIWYPGIADHSWGDIIPPYDRDGPNYPGKNWTDAGRAIYYNDCNALQPDLEITKTNNVNGSVSFGDTFTWTLLVTNTGGAAAVFDNNEDIIQDNLPNDADYSPSNNLTVTKMGGTSGNIDCDIDNSSEDLDCDASGTVTIPAGGSFSVTFTVEPEDAGDLANPRSGSGKVCKVDPDNRISNESNEGNNSCQDTVTVYRPQPDLTATKTNNLGEADANVGQPFTWTIRVENSGPGTAVFDESWFSDDELLHDYLPIGPVYGIPSVTSNGVTGTIGCDIVSNKLDCDANDATVTMPSGSWFEVSFTVTPNSVGTLNNPRHDHICKADPLHDISESNEGNNHCSDSVTVINPISSISGTKFNDLNGNGTQDEGELGLANWTIEAYANDALAATDTTDIDGNYTLVDLVPGSYRVREVNQAGWQQTTANPADVVLVGGQDITGVDFGNQGRATITVTKQVEPESQQTFGFTLSGDNLGEDEIFYLGDGQTWGEEQTVPAGDYSLSEDYNSDYTTTIDCSDEYDGTENGHQFTLSAGQEYSCTFTNTLRRGQITVTKYSDVDENGYRGESEPTLSGWEMILSQEGESVFETLIQTTEEGQTTFSDLLPGYYNLSEVFQDNWELTNINCSNDRGEDNYLLDNLFEGLEEDKDTSNNHSIWLAAGATIECFVGNHPHPVLGIDKTNNKIGISLNQGDIITYTITVTNDGPGAAHDLVITDVLPNTTMFELQTGSGILDNDGVISNPTPTGTNPYLWSVGTLEPGKTLTLTYQVKLIDASVPGTYTNIAKVDGTGSGPVTAGPADSSVQIGQVIGLSSGAPTQIIGQVLGATTGPETSWLWLALALSGSGLVLNLAGKKRKYV